MKKISSKNSNPRPVLTHEEATDVAKRIRVLAGASADRIVIEHSARTVIDIANNEVVDGTTGSELTLRFPTVMGTGEAMTVGMNQLDDATLKAIGAQVAALRPPPPDSSQITPDDPDDQSKITYGPQTYTPVALWHDSTAGAMYEPPAAASDVIERIKSAGLVGAATLALSARATYYSYAEGLEAWAEETDAELAVIARWPDGSAEGWAGQASRNIDHLVWPSVIDRAIDLAQRSRSPVAVEPGRYTAILEPAAVGQVIRLMMPHFFSYALAHDFLMGPFADRFSPSRTKLQERVLDDRLCLTSDPADPDGGFTPFFEMYDPYAGLPLEKMTFIDGGILKNLVYEPGAAAKKRKQWFDEISAVRLEPVPGTPVASTQEMIAHCALGIYVNRFDNVELVDGQNTGVQTGVTNGGCFLVKDGRIDRPIRNLRFVDSPFHFLNRILMVGKAERMAFGHTKLSQMELNDGALAWPPLGRYTRFPRLPMVAPPLMIQDFNFTAAADAV